MALAQEDFQRIGEFVKDNISLWLAEQSLGKPPVVYEIELRERMVRVEEELKHQRELMREGFERVDKRFEEMREDMDKRFEQVDKRFEQMDKRFDTMLRRHDHQFIALVALISSGIGLVIVALPFLLRI
jgi:predicted nucleotide-binding protein (sugar kinase/HSP70/actin superfamily)